MKNTSKSVGVLVLVVMIGVIWSVIMGSSQDGNSQQEPKVQITMFGAEWCPYCRQAKPIILGMQSKDVSVVYVDIDKRPDLKEKNHIRSIPVFIVHYNGADHRTQNVNEVASMVKEALR